MSDASKESGAVNYPMISVFRKIAASLDAMAPADRQIGQFVLDHPEKILQLTSADLARDIGRSQSSIVKFAQKLGFSGYQQMKLAVGQAHAQEWRAPDSMVHGTIERSDGFAIVLQKLMASKLASIENTVAINQESVIEQVVSWIHAAGRIHLTGVGASSLVARDFSYKLMKLRRMVMYDSDSHVQLANASALEAGDVTFALSHSGTSIETLRIAELATKRGAMVVAATAPGDNPLSRLADAVLHTVADEGRVRSSSITARDAQLALTDLLFILLVQRQKGAQELIRSSEAAVAVLKGGRSARQT